MSAPTTGRCVLGGGAMLLGATMLASHDFAAVWQPVAASGVARTVAAVAVGVLLAMGGGALQRARSAKVGAVVLTCLFAAFALLWIPRIMAAPGILGTWLGLAEECAVALASATLLWRSRSSSAASSSAASGLRRAFAICVLVFGSAHIAYPVQTAALVPGWLPPGPVAWVYITGVADLVAGASLLTGVRARLAAQLLAVMFGVFGALVWAPALIGKWTDQITWAGNALNLALVGAAWVIADGLVGTSAVPGRGRATDTTRLDVETEASAA